MMAPRSSGFVRLDDRRRAPLAPYTDLTPGDYYHVTRNADGSLTLTPASAKEA